MIPQDTSSPSTSASPFDPISRLTQPLPPALLALLGAGALAALIRRPASASLGLFAPASLGLFTDPLAIPLRSVAALVGSSVRPQAIGALRSIQLYPLQVLKGGRIGGLTLNQSIVLDPTRPQILSHAFRHEIAHALEEDRSFPTYLRNLIEQAYARDLDLTKQGPTLFPTFHAMTTPSEYFAESFPIYQTIRLMTQRRQLPMLRPTAALWPDLEAIGGYPDYLMSPRMMIVQGVVDRWLRSLPKRPYYLIRPTLLSDAEMLAFLKPKAGLPEVQP